MRGPMKILLATGLSLLVVAGARADALQGDQVGRFVASLEAMFASNAVSEQIMAIWQANREDWHYPGPLRPSELVTLLHESDVDRRFSALVDAHGFDDPDAWGATGDRVVLALMSLGMEGYGAEMRPKLAEMEREITSSSQFSDAQKQRLQSIIAQTIQLLAQVAEVSESDRAAVRPYRAELTSALDYRMEN